MWCIGSVDVQSQLLDVDGNTFSAPLFWWNRIKPFLYLHAQPGRLHVIIVHIIIAADQGVYTCRLPDVAGNVLDLNFGLYPLEFNGEGNTMALYMIVTLFPFCFLQLLPLLLA